MPVDDYLQQAITGERLRAEALEQPDTELAKLFSDYSKLMNGFSTIPFNGAKPEDTEGWCLLTVGNWDFGVEGGSRGYDDYGHRRDIRYAGRLALGVSDDARAFVGVGHEHGFGFNFRERVKALHVSGEGLSGTRSGVHISNIVGERDFTRQFRQDLQPLFGVDSIEQLAGFMAQSYLMYKNS